VLRLSLLLIVCFLIRGSRRAWTLLKLAWHWVVHGLIVLFGVVAGITTTVEAVIKVIDDYR